MKKIKTINSEVKFKLNITEDVERKIDYLCRRFPSKEWSGTLFYKVIAGDIQHLDQLVLETVDIYLQDIGQTTHTQFSMTQDILDIYEKYPELEDCKTGLVHDHNNMSVFFSGTDTSELEDNHQHYDFYLSLIVNNAGDRMAKIAIPLKKVVTGEVKKIEKISFKNAEGEWCETEGKEKIEQVSTSEDHMLVLDAEINKFMLPAFADQFFIDRVNVVDTPKVYTHTSHNYGNYGKTPLWEKKETKTPQIGLYKDVPNTKELIEFGVWLLSNGSKKAGSILSIMMEIESKQNVAPYTYANQCIVGLEKNFEAIFGTPFDANSKFVDNVVIELNQMIANIGANTVYFPKGYPMTEAVIDRLFTATYPTAQVMATQGRTHGDSYFTETSIYNYD